MSRLEPGLEFLPHLTLVEPLGSGGMGEVWIVRDTRRDEDVVAKILPTDASEEQVALLRREARLVRKLSHPGIVPVFGFEAGPHGSAVVSKLMKGGDATRLRGAAPLRVVRLGREVAGALGYLHGVGVVHRDVKATNVLLDEAGRAHVADFGIAAVSSPDEGVMVHGGGSRASMSPQQRGGAPASPADDIYSLGVLLYELLGGRPPFGPDASDDEIDTMAPPPFETAHEVPEGLRPLVASMLAKDPRGRPADMEQVGAVLKAIEARREGPGAGLRLQPPPRVPDVVVPRRIDPTPGPAVFPRPDPPRRRSRTQALFLAALGLAAVFVVLVLPRLASRAPLGGAQGEAPEGQAPAASAPPPIPAVAPPVSESPEPPEATPPPAEASPRRTAASEPTPAPRSAAAPVATPDRTTAEARQRAEAFGAAMSEAQAALMRQDWSASRAALERAAALEPGSPAVIDARQRVEEGERAAALARRRELAREYEVKEDWDRAVAEYDVALRLDPAVAFAREGRARAARRADLARQLDYHIAQPLRLATDAVAAEAEVLLQQAGEVEDPGPRLRRQQVALRQALVETRTSVPVVLESDGETDVVVHKVGHLGAFARKTLDLRPGTYTVIGKRSGYRDVRRQLVVEPRSSPPPFVVRCEEEI